MKLISIIGVPCSLFTLVFSFKEPYQSFQVLMATISLRRTKDKGLIGLPPKSVETCFVELSAEERELYDQMEAEGKCVIRDYIDAGSVMRNYSTVLGIILRLRQICTDVALCPSDLRSLLLSNNIEGITFDFTFPFLPLSAFSHLIVALLIAQCPIKHF